MPYIDDATLYNLGARRGGAEIEDRLNVLERAFALYLRADGWHLKDIAKVLELKMNDVKELLGE